jgi:hypothetical protein
MSPPRDRSIFRLVNLFTYLRHAYNIRRFRRRVGYFPDVARPLRYNEKMLWRKVFDRNPLFVIFSDKLAAKAFVSRLCPDLLLPEVLWVGDDASRIPAALLERPVVIKASHDCNKNFFPRPGNSHRDLPIAKLNRWLRRVHGRSHLEWAYGLAARKLFAEALIVPDPGDEIIDLSVHAVDGVPVFIEAITGNKTTRKRKGYFRADGARWPELDRKTDDARYQLPQDFRLPPSYVDAIGHTKRLGAGVDYARFDFIAASDRLYGGEITVYPGSGIGRHADFLVYNAVLSDRWDLTRSWFLRSGHGGLRRHYAEALGRFLAGGGGQA